jgi:hypothetical protein
MGWNDLETAVECYRVLAHWGRSPRPPSEGVPPPASPLLNPFYWCTLRPTGAVQSLGGGNKRHHRAEGAIIRPIIRKPG